MFNYLIINIVVLEKCIELAAKISFCYRMFSIEIFYNVFNCWLFKKIFFFITKLIYVLITELFLGLKLMKINIWVECNISVFNCTFQRRVFKKTMRVLKNVFFNLPPAVLDELQVLFEYITPKLKGMVKDFTEIYKYILNLIIYVIPSTFMGKILYIILTLMLSVSLLTYLLILLIDKIISLDEKISSRKIK